ncbi:diacylglycerol kinase family protein [Nocardioides sp. R-C-SC26]|uniref:diacylglycerol/lipid kinase family protein n=1 Tax=Nocardioides sp. R-C-SC26 TaxID=2870414 RepID=UPI001E41DE82|nr:diacylglycerol kinase family protein [Nocardioides sp. R-C-SC26]
MNSPTREREVVVFANPAAGQGAADRRRKGVTAVLRSAGITVRSVAGRDADEASDLLRGELDRGADGLVVVGGDGSVHLALQELAGTGVPLGLVPCGTGNDVARYLGLRPDDPVTAVRRIVAGRTRRIDLARSAGRYYATVLAAGFDAIVNERANAMRWPRGQMRYNLATLAELRVLEPRHYVLDVDGRTLQFEAILVAVGNGPSFGGGLRITEGAVLDDGLLDVVVIKPMGRAELVRTYPRLFTGTHTTHRCYEHARGTRITVAAPGIVAYADGERFAPLPLTVQCIPGALEVFA